MSRVLPQLIVFSYHKSGTTLFWHVMRKVAAALDLSMANHYGRVDHLPPEPDVILLPHSMLQATLDRPYRAIRLIRDPRDIWVSGYLYHLRCVEEWCINEDFDLTLPISWPKVDHCVDHMSQHWKRRYLESLGGKSYQQNLLDRSLADGLEFELQGYTGWTLATMREWTQNGAEALDIMLEDIAADFDGLMLRVFDHFGFTANQRHVALAVARSEDVQRMDDASIAERPQIHSRIISKWQDVLSAEQVARFQASYGDLIRDLGYELADSGVPISSRQNPSACLDNPSTPVGAIDSGTMPRWLRLPPRPSRRNPAPEVTTATTDAGVRLSADGASIRPVTFSRGVFTFVVPPDRKRISLESRHGPPPGLPAPNSPPDGRVGLRVNQIAIQSAAGEVVIPADDPILTRGWHPPELAGAVWWRWTDGSAEIPWTGVSGQAIVSVRCETLAGYPPCEFEQQD